MTINRPPRAPRPRRDDSGVAMVLVIGFSMLLLGLALVVTQSVIRQIVPSERADHSFAALAAAEAGIFEYHKHLLDNNAYYLDDGTNPALTGWVCVPGSGEDSTCSSSDWANHTGNEADSEYTIRVDRTRLGSAGELTVYAVGRAPRDNPNTTADDNNQVVRVVQAIWSKRSTLDYVYMSDIETPAPDLPGAYSTAANSGGTGKTAQELARLLCSRHWYESGQVDATGTQGTQRNLNFCQWAGIYNTESLVGRLHTNDVWRLDTVNLSGAITPGNITSSCRNSTEGLLNGEVGCGTIRRYIANTPSGINSNNGANAKWTSSTTYQGNAWRPTNTSPDPTLVKTAYASVLELPQTPALLKKRAGDTGCVYTGPTRLHFTADGYVYVTSPDTKFTANACGGGANGAYLSSGTTIAPTTAKVALSDFIDPVFYVQDVQRPQPGGVDPDPKFAYDVPNQWATVTPPTTPNEPTCKPKYGTNTYPFVIPNLTVDTTESASFNTTATGLHYKGFPSELADIASPWYSGNCAVGDAYVQGKYLGRVTLATESNIVITGSLAEANSSTTTGATYGKPNSTSDSLVGLVSKKFTYLYRPFAAAVNSNPQQWVGDWKEANSRDPVLDVAILAISECFAAQDPYTGTAPSDPTYGAKNGNIYLWGSIAQKYRCVVGSTGGYNKVYKYDDRLTRTVPPAMLELSDEDWATQTSSSDASVKAPFSEITPRRQVVGVTTNWQLTVASDHSATVDSKKIWVVAGNVSSTPTVSSHVVNGEAVLTMAVSPTTTGLVIIRYELKHVSKTNVNNAVTESRALVIWVDPTPT